MLNLQTWFENFVSRHFGSLEGRIEASQASLLARVDALENYLKERFREERIFREEFSHGLKRELLTDLEARQPQVPRGISYPGYNAIFMHSTDGHRLLLDPDEPFMTMHMLEHGLWEPEVRAVMSRILKPGGVFVDVGANIGLHTLYAATCVGEGGKVFAVEPHPRLHRLLKLNVEINGFAGRVSLHAAAASDTDEAAVDFEYFPDHPGMSGFAIAPDRIRQLKGHGERIQVRACRLDSLIDGNVEPDLVKIDVEGFEHKVMAGAARILAGKGDTGFILEWEPQIANGVMAPDATSAVCLLFADAGMVPFRCCANGPPEMLNYEVLPTVERADILFLNPKSKHFEAATA